MKQDLLIELGTEEIPARFIAEGERSFGQKLTEWLQEMRIDFETYQTFSTPRRLAVLVQGVDSKQADRIEEVRGPAAKIAQTADGAWSKAALGFARKQGIDAQELILKEHKGHTYVFAQKQETGAKTVDLLQAQLYRVFESISFPTTMRWGAGFRFIRPIRWLVCLFGEQVVPVTWAGLTADRMSRGHRFLGSSVTITAPSTYVAQLREESVWVDVAKRRESIVSQLQNLEQQHNWNIPIDEALLDEVTHLVEYPTVLTGQFDADFLTLPRSVLITTMREHQRYFPVEDKNGDLLPYFVSIRNGDHRYLDMVSKGNEKVLGARLADARFFYEEDLKRPIEDAVNQLDRIVFRKELGSIGDRVRRIERLTTEIAKMLACEKETLQLAIRAAQICKFDLATQMVDEFAKLEGEMGYEYARAAGEDDRVAEAIREHLRPRSADDELPQGQIGTILALADKIDMITSCFAIGIVPTGSQDPYSLRRKALGILQILLNYPNLSLQKLVHIAIRELESAGLIESESQQEVKSLFAFFAGRFRTILQAAEIRYDVIDAILAQEITYPSLMLDRAKVLMQRVEQDEFKYEVEGYTRIDNLVYANQPESELKENLLLEPAEQALFEVYKKAKMTFDHASDKQKANEMYQALQSMVPTIHRFFDEVMVMTDDQTIRENRLALLALISQLTARFADFRKLVFP